MPDLASKEQIGVFNYYKLKMMCLLGYITHMRSGRTHHQIAHILNLCKNCSRGGDKGPNSAERSTGQGWDVEYWKVLDRIKIVRIKG
jgi:hypothetical protein